MISKRYAKSAHKVRFQPTPTSKSLKLRDESDLRGSDRQYRIYNPLIYLRDSDLWGEIDSLEIWSRNPGLGPGLRKHTISRADRLLAAGSPLARPYPSVTYHRPVQSICH